ncbi:hypothetical protein ABIC47_002060 [Leifsonia sp. 563]
MSGEQISTGAQAWWMSARLWWAGQGRIPRRRTLTIITAVVLLVALISPGDGFTWMLLVGFYIPGILWVRHFRRLHDSRGFGLLGWGVVAGGGVALLVSGVIVAIPGSRHMSR